MFTCKDCEIEYSMLIRHTRIGKDDPKNNHWLCGHCIDARMAIFDEAVSGITEGKYGLSLSMGYTNLAILFSDWVVKEEQRQKERKGKENEYMHKL